MKNIEKEDKIILTRIFITSLILIFLLVVNIPGNIKIVLYIIAYIIIGYEVVIDAIKNILHKELFDENFLMCIATIGALSIGEYPEAVCVMLFFEIGEFLQDKAVEKSKKSISKLMDIKPECANVERNNKITKVKVESVKVGSIIVVKPGEKVPIDGIVIKGSSSLNTVALTGESLPRVVNVNDKVLSGSVNINQVLYIKTTTTFTNSTVSKILDLVENAEDNKAEAEKYITKFARVYTPIVVILALLITIIPTLICGEFTKWLYRSLIFLVISCPCALVISVPLGFFAGIGCSSKNGVLIKGANYLEDLTKIKTIIFDKTGTLTKGNFKVIANHPEKIGEDKLLEIAMLAESYSNHPISVSLKEAYGKEVKINKKRVKDIEEISGKGIKAIIDNKIIYVGNEKLMKMIKVESRNCEKDGTIIHIASNGEYLGHIVVADEIKENAYDSINELKNMGLNVVMLTGDKKNVGNSVGKKLGINVVKTELLPTDKVKEVKEIIDNKGNYKDKVIFVGDGINDAPVLKISDIGISMGGLGSDAAIEASDIVLMKDDLSSITKAIKIAKKTLRIVNENIIMALVIKVVVLVLGSLGMVSMWAAVFADVGVSLLAILNSLRCMKE